MLIFVSLLTDTLSINLITMNKKVLFIRLVSKFANNLIACNFGYEIVKKDLQSHNYDVTDRYFDEGIPWVNTYDIIFFNILYVGHYLNFLPFLKRYNIEPDRLKRNKKPLLIVGGAGATNFFLLSSYVDYEHSGYINSNTHSIMYVDTRKLCES